MPAHNRRLKLISFTVSGTDFACQVQSWTLDPGIEDGDRRYTFCPDGEFLEETDPDPTLELTFFADWRSGGVSDFLWTHQGETAGFVLDHHPNIPGEHVRWAGTLVLKPGPVGGEARDTETTEVTLQLLSPPTYTRMG